MPEDVRAMATDIRSLELLLGRAPSVPDHSRARRRLPLPVLVAAALVALGTFAAALHLLTGDDGHTGGAASGMLPDPVEGADDRGSAGALDRQLREPAEPDEPASGRVTGSDPTSGVASTELDLSLCDALAPVWQATTVLPLGTEHVAGVASVAPRSTGVAAVKCTTRGGGILTGDEFAASLYVVEFADGVVPEDDAQALRAAYLGWPSPNGPGNLAETFCEDPGVACRVEVSETGSPPRPLQLVSSIRPAHLRRSAATVGRHGRFIIFSFVETASAGSAFTADAVDVMEAAYAVAVDHL